jgi:putative phosphoesterase
MKIILVSDTHGHDELLEKVALIESRSDIFLHAGDSNSSNIFPFQVVKGNCDVGIDYPSIIYIDTPYGKLKLMHGHQFMQFHSFNAQRVKESIEKENVKILVYGHTHIQKVLEIEGYYLINPGALNNKTMEYLVLEVSETEVLVIKKNLN